VGPLGYFIHISITTPHRHRLEKLLYIELSIEVPTDILNHFWIQVLVSEVKRPLRNRLEVKRLQIYSGYM
jgi:hypothetical protein